MHKTAPPMGKNDLAQNINDAKTEMTVSLTYLSAIMCQTLL